MPFFAILAIIISGQMTKNDCGSWYVSKAHMKKSYIGKPKAHLDYFFDKFKFWILREKNLARLKSTEINKQQIHFCDQHEKWKNDTSGRDFKTSNENHY